MTKLFSLSATLIATIFLIGSTCEAQMFNQGYQVGAGIQAAGFGNCGGFFRSIPREAPPYFAQYPPVYYSHVVPRPYGFSPYAVPGGVMPAEMGVVQSAPAPTMTKNPHFNPPSLVPDETPAAEGPVVNPAATDKAADTQTTSARNVRGWVRNPHAGNSPKSLVKN